MNGPFSLAAISGDVVRADMAPPGVTAIRCEIDPNRLPDTSSSNSRLGPGRILQQLLYDCADDLVALLCRHAISNFQLKPDRPGEHIGRRLRFRVLLAVTIDVPSELCSIE